MQTVRFVHVEVRYREGRVDSSVYEAAIAAELARGWHFVQIFVENPAAVPDRHTLIFTRLVDDR